MLSHSGLQWRHIALYLTKQPNLVNCINLNRYQTATIRAVSFTLFDIKSLSRSFNLCWTTLDKYVPYRLDRWRRYKNVRYLEMSEKNCSFWILKPVRFRYNKWNLEMSGKNCSFWILKPVRFRYNKWNNTEKCLWIRFATFWKILGKWSNLD